MSMTELGTFCIDYLAAVEGLNQDGGGSSTMWLNGTVMNVPSDGSERYVANGLFMATACWWSSPRGSRPAPWCVPPASAALRIGPGINYNSSGSVAANTEGVVLDHTLNGRKCRIRTCGIARFRAQWLGRRPSLRWRVRSAGDYTGDGRVDAADLPPLAYCLRGPGLMYNPGTFCLGGYCFFHVNTLQRASQTLLTLCPLFLY